MNTSIGVVIGRFQVPEFHEGYRELFEIVEAHHSRVLILIGVTPFGGTKRDPLDYKTRLQMFKESYPQFEAVPIPDAETDEKWSQIVDQRIREVFPMGDVIIYGGRDSFITHYSGRFKTQDAIVKSHDSGTIMREFLALYPTHGTGKRATDFRSGVIYSTMNRYEVPGVTVDGAILREGDDMGKSDTSPDILLVRKTGETGWRMVGGFVDPKDESYEEAIRREVLEEVDISVMGKPIYAGSFNVKDWRSSRTGTSIVTALYIMSSGHGSGTPHDDVSESRWFRLGDLDGSDMIPCHAPLLEAVKGWSKDAKATLDKYYRLYESREQGNEN